MSALLRARREREAQLPRKGRTSRFLISFHFSRSIHELPMAPVGAGRFTQTERRVVIAVPIILLVSAVQAVRGSPCGNNLKPIHSEHPSGAASGPYRVSREAIRKVSLLHA